MRHAVLGAGGVGGLLAGALARAGLPVLVIRRPGTPPLDRVHVRSQVLGEFEAELRSAERLEEDVDVLWVTVKAGALEGALAAAPAEHVRLAVVPLLNGVDHMEPLRARYGERALAGTIRVEAERVAPGEIVQNGPFIAIDLAGPGADRVAADVEATGIRASVHDDQAFALWAKLIMLAPFALTSTAAQRDLGGIAADRRWRGLMLGCMHEVREVAAAQGIELVEPAQMLEVAPPTMRTSMQKDAAAGRPLELEHIAGPILRGGREHGIPTPATQELVDLIQARNPG
jgi:2-dehydropantoate 2-reductase